MSHPQEQTEAERQRVLSQFQGLRLSLEELSRHLLARLGHLRSDIGRVQEENVTSLTEEISRLDCRVQELEEKCRQPARTFLQVTRDPAALGGVWSRPAQGWNEGVSGGPFSPKPFCGGQPKPVPRRFSRWMIPENLVRAGVPVVLSDSPGAFSPSQDIGGTLSRYGRGFPSSSPRPGLGSGLGSRLWPRLGTEAFGICGQIPDVGSEPIPEGSSGDVRREFLGVPPAWILNLFLPSFSSLGKEKLQLPPSPLPELGKKIHRFREEYALLEETLRSFQGIGSRLADEFNGFY